MKEVQKRIVATIVFITLLLNVAPIDCFDVYAAENWTIDNKTNDVRIYSSTIKGTDLISIFQSLLQTTDDEFKYAYDIPDNHYTNWLNYGILVDPNEEYSLEFGTGDSVDIFAAPEIDWDRGEGTKITIKKSYTVETEPIDHRQPAVVNELSDKNIGKFNTESEFDIAVRNVITASWSNSEGYGSVDPQDINVGLTLTNEKKNEFGETVRLYSVTVTVSEGENWLALEQPIVFDDVYWTVNQYTISFNTDGGTAVLPVKQDYGTNITPPDDPTKAGYTFLGWDQEIPVTMPAENITITAKWESSTKKVNFNPSGGTWSDGSTDSKILTLNKNDISQDYQAPKRNGYDFVGWQQQETAEPGADESYEAIWNHGKTVTFKDGDTVYEDNYAFGETVTAPVLAEKVGYTFVGWDLVGLNGVGNGFKDQVISVMGNESLVYVAIWQANEYTVYFYNENDELIEAITAKYGAPFGISITPTKTGHTFVGWDLKKDGMYDAIADAVSPTMGAEDLEYREIFAIGQYTITFDSVGGSAVAPITQSYGTDIVVPADPTKEGYKFAGWDQGVPLTMPALNITLIARWEKAKYSISWDMNADGVIDDRDIVTTVEHGDIPVLPEAEVPVKESTAEFSYVFTNSWLPAIKPAEGDATYTAQYDAVLRKYTVKFLNYDGTPLQTSEVEYGSTPVYSGSTPIKIDDKQYDYTFAGWSPIVESVTKDAVYTATFTESIKKYTVVWKNWDGSVLETDHAVEHGDFPKYNGKTPTKPATEAVNYVFEGWDPQISGVTGDVTYTATFKEEAKTFSITWLAEDGSIIDVTVVEYGKIPAYAAPIKPSTAEYSYTFAGWNPSPVAVTEDAIYTASYAATKNKYTVTWNVDGDRTSESYEYGVLPEFKGSTDKATDGCTVYSFTGWDKKITEVASNVEYIATYSTATVHISTEIVYSDITKTTHDEIYACCKAVKNDNAAHNFIDNYCVCGAKKTVTIVIMNGDSVLETIESEDTDISVSDMPTPTPTPGYVFSGWYTEDGVRVDSETDLADDMVLHAGYFSGDVDGDGTIEKEDVDKLTRYIVGQDVATVEDEKAFDINGDGDVTVVDSILLLLHISGKRPMTP